MSATVDAARLLGPLARLDAPLGARTTYRVGGNAAVLVEPRHDEDLAAVARAVAETGVDVLVLGRGSNLVVADAGFDGVVVALGEHFAGLDVQGTTVRAGGGLSLPVLARRAAAAGVRGLEWMVGVPGSVGGAVRMNAGGHGSDTAASLREVRVANLRNGDHGVVDPGSLHLGYRSSSVAPHVVVVEARFEGESGDRHAAEAEIAEIVRWRRANQPGGQNAGSVFTNPPGDSAGRLVDAAGLRGLRLGTAHVSERHANFIQADEGGSGDDVAALIAEVQRRVADRFGIVLHPEVRLVGFSARAEVPAP